MYLQKVQKREKGLAKKNLILQKLQATMSNFAKVHKTRNEPLIDYLDLHELSVYIRASVWSHLNACTGSIHSCSTY